jgi:hypothetical protein
MDYAKALTFVLDDTRWKEKIAVGAGLALGSLLLSVILIGWLGFFILFGYSVRLLQNVRNGQQFPLPEWDDWGGDLVRGLKYFVVYLVWALPFIIFTVPVAIGSAIAEGGGAGEFFGASLLFCGTCLMVIYGLFVALVTPGFTIAYATDENIKSGLQFTDIWHWTQANIGQVVIAVLVILLASLVIQLVASIAGTLLCFIGLVVTVPLGALVTYLYQFNLYGQLAYQFPYGGFGGITQPASPPPADLATEAGAPVVETPAPPIPPAAPATEEPPAPDDIAPDDTPADDTPADDQPGEEDKPA